MKKTILVILMVVMIATPCFAQEIEPEGIFSLHGTAWETLPMGIQIFPFPSPQPMYNSEFGFYGGIVYPWKYNYSFYIDMLVCSIFWAIDIPTIGGGSITRSFGILQPTGVGLVFENGLNNRRLPTLKIGLLIKTSDNWTPPEVE